MGKQLLATKMVEGVRQFVRQVQAKPKDRGDECYMCNIKMDHGMAERGLPLRGVSVLAVISWSNGAGSI